LYSYPSVSLLKKASNFWDIKSSSTLKFKRYLRETSRKYLKFR
jgi:hypothetical protein